MAPALLPPNPAPCPRAGVLGVMSTRDREKQSAGVALRHPASSRQGTRRQPWLAIDGRRRAAASRARPLRSARRSAVVGVAILEVLSARRVASSLPVRPWGAAFETEASE